MKNLQRGATTPRTTRFSDRTSACMVLSDTIFVMVLTHEKWAQFTSKPIADARRASEVMLALSADRMPQA